MICDSCKERDAVVHLTQIVDNAVTKLDLCEKCAAARGIETLIHYPLPLTAQKVFASCSPARCPVAERVCGEVCSLPLHAALADDDVDAVVAAVLEAAR